MPTRKMLSTATRWLNISTATALIVPTLFFFAAISYTYNSMIARAYENVDNTVRVTREHALKVFELTDSLGARVDDILDGATAAEIAADEKPLHGLLKSLADTHAHVLGMAIMGPDGQGLVGSGAYPYPKTLNYRHRDFYRAHTTEGKLEHIGEPYMAPIAKSAVFPVTRARKDRNGNYAGAVLVFIHHEYFSNFYKELAERMPGLGSVLVREDGVILSQTDSGTEDGRGVVRRMGERGFSPMLARIRGGMNQDVYMEISGRDNRARIFAYQRIGKYPLYVGAGILKDAIFDSWWRQSLFLALFTFPLSICLAGAIHFAMRKTRTAVLASQKAEVETKKRRTAEEALYQSQRLETVGRLTGGIAHDFNNLLMVISNNCQIMALKDKENRYKGNIEALYRVVHQGSVVTQTLLEFSNRKPVEDKPVLVNDAFESITRLISRSFPSIIETRVRVADDIKYIQADASLLEVALLNLAMNSRDAMPLGGILTFTARRSIVPDETLRPMIALEVSDTGEGIAENIISKVFDPYFTTKPKGKGSGMGLSNVYSFCLRCEGQAVIHSTEGVGTTVTMFLNEVAAPDPSTSTDSYATRKIDGEGEPILVVDDKVELAEGVGQLLTGMNFKIDLAETADEAMDLIRLGETRYKMVLSDVVMPGVLNGLTFAQKLRGEVPELPVILMTGYMENYEETRREGFTVLPKPVLMSRLIDSMLKLRVGKEISNVPEEAAPDGTQAYSSI